MRKKILAGNWKMNTSIDEGWTLYQEIQNKWKGIGNDNLICIIAPPSTHLLQLASSVKDHLFLAAQNCSEYESGAHTGENAASAIKSVGADYVIIGHSERRTNNGETNTILKSKVDQALANGLIPIYCCGESEQARDENSQESVVREQLMEGLFHLSPEEFGKVVVAYEPVWAIGTGETATPEQAQQMHSFIRNMIGEKYDTTVADALSILYVGSCNPDNADVLFANEDVDGGLIGGASLKANDFIQIANSLKG